MFRGVSSGAPREAAMFRSQSPDGGAAASRAKRMRAMYASTPSGEGSTKARRLRALFASNTSQISYGNASDTGVSSLGLYTQLPMSDGMSPLTELPVSDADASRVRERLAIQLRMTKNRHESSLLEKVVESRIFQASMAAIIGANALIMGLETDMPNRPMWDELEKFFLAAFLAELVMKIAVQGWRLVSCSNDDLGWNVFDCAVVSLGMFDLILDLVLDKSSGNLATLLRIVRLLRIMRLFRLVKFLKQLYLLAFGFVDAVQAIFWVTMLMSVVLYVCSIVMVRTVGRLPSSDPHAEFLHGKFADMATSMLTLFVLMSSPDLPDFLKEEGMLVQRPLLLFFLIIFIIIGSFGMIALLTGVISEGVFEKNQLRMDETRRELDEFMLMLEAKAEEVFNSLEVDEGGGATHEEVEKNAIPFIADLFEAAMIDYTDYQLRQLVEVMDVSHNGKIECAEFTHAVISYASGVKPLSIQEVHHAVTDCHHKLAGIEQRVEVILKQLLWQPCAGKADAGADAKLVTPEPALNGASGSAAGCSHRGATRSATAPAEKLESAMREGSKRASWQKAAGLGQEALEAAPVQSLKDLERCVRECSEVQLAAQQELEAFIRQELVDLHGRLQERLGVAVSDWRRVPLPGAFEVGDRVVSKISFAFTAGSVARGDIGIVRGPCTGADPGRVNVDFPNLRSANMLPAQISPAASEAAEGSPAGSSGAGGAPHPPAAAAAPGDAVAMTVSEAASALAGSSGGSPPGGKTVRLLAMSSDLLLRAASQAD